jgi:hypothetical protein
MFMECEAFHYELWVGDALLVLIGFDFLQYLG